MNKILVVGTDGLELLVSDNGIRLSKDFQLESTKSLGLHLVTILAQDQLGSTLKMLKKPGTHYKICFKRKWYQNIAMFIGLHSDERMKKNTGKEFLLFISSTSLYMVFILFMILHPGRIFSRNCVNQKISYSYELHQKLWLAVW